MEYNKWNCIYDILSLYYNELPFVVSEYFCRIFNSQILCRFPIKYKTFFDPFKEYKDHVTYLFQNIGSDNDEYKFVRLVSITILIKLNQEEECMYKFSNFIHPTNCHIEWFDQTPDGYVGRCTISF